MKKIILAAMLFSAAFFSACSSGNSSENKKDTIATKAKAVKYTCTMDPQVISDTPGHCPICGMELVPIKEDSTTHMNDSIKK